MFYFLFALTFSSVCRTGLLHSEFWALLNKSPRQRAALQPRGGNLHQHHSVWTGQPGAAGQGPVQDGELYIYLFGHFIHIVTTLFTLFPQFLSGWRGGPSKSLDEGYGPASTAGLSIFLTFDVVLKGFFPKTADSLVILLTTSCKEIYYLIFS